MTYGTYLCGFCAYLVTFGSLLDNTWAYLEQEDISNRFGESLLEPGLPLWLEKRSEVSEPDLTYSDPPWEPIPVYLSEMDPLESRMAHSMELRSLKELELTRRALEGEAVPYEGFDDTAEVDTSTIPRRVARAVDSAPLTPPTGLRSKLNWKPIAIGSMCAVLGVFGIIGASFYYQRVHLAQKTVEGRETEAGSLFRDRKSPPESLLGETTSLSLDGDRKLAHSAQMYHYQHQKQQMLAVERASDHAQVSEEGSGSDADEGDFTVYECPGLAEPGQLELENPLYEGDSMVPGPSIEGEAVHAARIDDESDSTPMAKTLVH